MKMIRVTGKAAKTYLAASVSSCEDPYITAGITSIAERPADLKRTSRLGMLKILKTGVIAYGVNEPLLIYRISRGSKSGNRLKTVRKTYGVFRLIGINPVGSAYFTARNLLGAVKKYSGIKK